MRRVHRACSPGDVAARTPPTAGQRRFGHLVAIVVDAVMLWGAHQLLGRGWFPFVTEAWTAVLPLVTASLIVAIVANVLLAGYDGPWLKAPLNVVQAVLGIVVSARMWQVFPFDFSGYDFPWTAVARVLIVLSIVGSAIAILAELRRLVRAATA